MPDYQPLNISSLCNVAAEILGENTNPAIGEQTFHGLPFQIGVDDHCFLGFGNGASMEPTTIPLNADSRNESSSYIGYSNRESLKAIPSGA